MYSFVCEKCGGTFQSKSDPSKWKNRICNDCRGNKYATNPRPQYNNQYTPTPIGGAMPQQQYSPPPSPQVKPTFNKEDYMADMLVTYQMLKDMTQSSGLTIPEDCLCSWTTSIMIQQQKMGG